MLLLHTLISLPSSRCLQTGLVLDAQGGPVRLHPAALEVSSEVCARVRVLELMVFIWARAGGCEVQVSMHASLATECRSSPWVSDTVPLLAMGERHSAAPRHG